MILVRKEVITNKSKNAFEVLFDFDSAWDGLVRIAQFRSDGVSKSWILGEDCKCIIPWEVLVTPNRPLQIGVCGVDNDTTILPTIWLDAGMIQEGAFGGEISSPPTPSLQEQIVRMIGNLDDLVTSDKSNLVNAINEVARTGGAGGGTGEQGTVDHNKLINRDMKDQHPIQAINGLEEQLDEKIDSTKLGDNLEINTDGNLQVKMADAMEQDNTLPISSAGVYTQVGNINALLSTI